MNKVEIDAKNKTIGRVATQAAMSLMGKDEPTYKANVVPNVKVEIKNVSSAKISDKRKLEKEYTSYTGYPGGLRKTSMTKLIEKKGLEEVYKKAVYGMLPNNRLRKLYMKNLIVTE